MARTPAKPAEGEKPADPQPEDPAVAAEKLDLDQKDEEAAAKILTTLHEHVDTDRFLHRKLADIMEIAERIPKRGTADRAMGGYPFVLVGDAADFIRKALGRRHVSMTPTKVVKIDHHEHPTARGNVMTTVELIVTWTLTDGDTGESTVIETYGVGADTGDKYSGKAMTSAMKYAFLSGFQLSTGDDVEKSDTSDRLANTGERPAVTGNTGQSPAHGGRQQTQTVPQSKVIGDLLRQGGAGTTDKAVVLLQQLSGKTIELGDDKAAGLAKFLSDGLTPNERGKLVHDLQKYVKDLAKPEAATEAAAPAAGGESSPGAPVGEPPDESLEATPEA